MEQFVYLLNVLMGALIMPLTQQMKVWLKINSPLFSFTVVLTLTVAASLGLARVVAPEALPSEVWAAALTAVISAITTKVVHKNVTKKK